MNFKVLLVILSIIVSVFSAAINIQEIDKKDQGNIITTLHFTQTPNAEP